MMRYGAYSKKGFRGSGMRLHHSDYFRFTFEGHNYFFKEKHYVSAYDGYSVLEVIKEATYTNAVKKGRRTEEIVVEVELSEVPLDVLINIMESKYEEKKSDLREAIFNAQEVIRYYEKIYADKIRSKTKLKIFSATIKLWLDYVIPKKELISN